MAKPTIETYHNQTKTARKYQARRTICNAIIAGKKFHFVGAGGVGMSGLAQLLIKNKAIITGSDQMTSAVVERLNNLGAAIAIGHNAENLPPRLDSVVISAAIKEDNPELKAAREKGCTIYKYAQMLGTLMDSYEGIAIAGTHGKSTTTGWLVYLLKQAGADPSFIVGADICQLGCSSGTGDGTHFVAEACEYDRSFLHLKPTIACILNIEQDHLDYYKDLQEIIEAFRQFALGVRKNGLLIINGEDPNAAKIIGALPAGFNFQTFGYAENCTFTARNIRQNDGLYCFDVYHNDKFMGQTRTSLPGWHNILNALAVVAIAANAAINPRQILQILPDFVGMDRRLMLKAQFNRITILDDYAHHPTEIKASLAAIRNRFRPKRLCCVFQPHQYSRTRFLLDDFAESFKLADITIVPEIYFVRDTLTAQKEVNSRMLVERIESKGTKALFIDGFGPICDYLKENVTGGDVVVTMGAGDIWKVADEYIQWLRRDR